MGADQVVPGQATGPLTMEIEADYTNVAVGFALNLIAQNQGRILTSVWDFGDGMFATNQPLASHAWSAPGSYLVRLIGYNDSEPSGVAATLEVQVAEPVYYVNVANPAPVFPYANWTTAATNLQQAIDAGSLPGRLVLVTDGVYRAGSTSLDGLNRVALLNAPTVRSVHGPEVTIIEGEDDIRCAYLEANAMLSGFTLRNGRAPPTATWGNHQVGGGAFCASRPPSPTAF